MIRVSKHGPTGAVLAIAEVETIAQAHAFLDQLNPDGSVIAAAPERDVRRFNDAFDDRDRSTTGDWGDELESGRLPNLPQGDD